MRPIGGGGPSIQEACRKLAPIPLGEAAVTEAGRLRARFVNHAASMSAHTRTTDASLRHSVRKSLARCVEHGIRTVAFPAIGTGVAGFPMDGRRRSLPPGGRRGRAAGRRPRQARLTAARADG